jgi:hypothetical protein
MVEAARESEARIQANITKLPFNEQGQISE